ncbi:alpha/beta hydrolase [Macrococcus hajekii]|uniref:Alpha/beta hydrolase n=1 Tax=Macrococcus hajekii TaxID=198482 RepID=A0A4R6BIT8_9STAP|nr:alpha/beta hydrolase [Macrococcus hajekii]TDM01575.1 alpha/beta hydrolase [Macrococcus hajekii]GGB01137.1 hypothetical protein GCM10007190_06530 [Macrococcus hajekii]
MKHVLFVHSASEQHRDSGSNPLIRYLKSQLPDIEWHTPDFPRDKGQVYSNWVQVLKEELEHIPVEDELMIIGHSFGGTVVMKYLTEQKERHHISKVILIGSPFFGCDEKFSDAENMLSEDAESQLADAILLYHIHSEDDDRVDISHQTCWREHFKKLNTITKQEGQHEFHHGIEELLPIIEE